MISVLVVKNGTGKPVIGETIQSPLITSEPQAAAIGKQRVIPLAHRRKDMTVSAPYMGIVDGDRVSVEKSPLMPVAYQATGVEIDIDESGVWTSVSLKRFEP